MADAKYRVGQIVVMMSIRAEMPFRILDVYADEYGGYCYAFNKKNYVDESMVRLVRPEEL